MSDQVEASLRKLFQEHRVVFWYDKEKELRSEFESLNLSDIEKIEIANNEFGLKYKILRQYPKKKFLLFKDGPEPEQEDNWLLDLQLATVVFSTDQAAMVLSELGLPNWFGDIVHKHKEFFRANSRIVSLKSLLDPKGNNIDLLMCMLAVCAETECKFYMVVEKLLGELSTEKNDIMHLFNRLNLADFFWQQIEKTYGYVSSAPSLDDFAIILFEFCCSHDLGNEKDDDKLNAEAHLMFRRWKNNRLNASAFERLSERYQTHLSDSLGLPAYDIKRFGKVDYFRVIDQYIIKTLVADMASQAISLSEVLKILDERRHCYWYSNFEYIYRAIFYATKFRQALASADLTMNSLSDGIKRYASSWYEIDQHYRKFVFFVRKSGQTSIFENLLETIENQYSTNFLLTLNDAWQDQVSELTEWKIEGYPRQTDFYINHVADFRRRDQKVAVIISDALRYEVAEECLREIKKQDRFEAELIPMISVLPSYTQLGQAALLPNSDLMLLESASVKSFGLSTQGTIGREKVLRLGRSQDRVKAMKADEFSNLKSDDGKAVFREHDVLYLYHNRIDVIGENPTSEERLTEAIEETIEDITRLVRKLTTANFSNILVSADHGFIYQYQCLDQADFSVADPKGNKIHFKNRRFVIGEELNETEGMKKFSSSNLGLSGDLEILIPNSINRLRIKGSGSRYVHGGATLQEIIVPILKVGKRRESDISIVDVQIIVTGRNLISSGQIAVVLFQVQPISEKLRERHLKVGIYSKDGTLISDEHSITFDYSSQSAREREVPLTFLLSREAEHFNNQDVFLQLKQKIRKTSLFEDYASHQFHLRRGISTDFDF